MSDLVQRLRAGGFHLTAEPIHIEAADTIEALCEALRLWQRYDDLDSGKANGLTPMLAYGEAIEATDAALAKAGVQ